MVMKHFTVIDKISADNFETTKYQIACSEDIKVEILQNYMDDAWVGKSTMIISETLYLLLYLKYHEAEKS